MLAEALIFCSLSFVKCDVQPIIEQRVVTAYTLSIHETDDTPCIGATGENLCEALERGESICAANFVPFGTILKIDGYGACRVADRTARKYGQRVDILMKNRADAIKWGKQTRTVEY